MSTKKMMKQNMVQFNMEHKLVPTKNRKKGRDNFTSAGKPINLRKR